MKYFFGFLAIFIFTTSFLQAEDNAKQTSPSHDQPQAQAKSSNSAESQPAALESEESGKSGKIEEHVPSEKSLVPPQITSHDDIKKINFTSHDNELYINLAREMERSQRDHQQEDSLKLLKQELESRRKELSGIQQTLSKDIKKKTEENENLRLLVTLYESMKASEVSELLKRMPLTFSVTILKMMSPKKSSKVLAVMDPKMAAQVSRLLIQSPEIASNGGTP